MIPLIDLLCQQLVVLRHQRVIKRMYGSLATLKQVRAHSSPNMPRVGLLIQSFREFLLQKQLIATIKCPIYRPVQQLWSRLIMMPLLHALLGEISIVLTIDITSFVTCENYRRVIVWCDASLILSWTRLSDEQLAPSGMLLHTLLWAG